MTSNSPVKSSSRLDRRQFPRKKCVTTSWQQVGSFPVYGEVTWKLV